MGSGPIPVVFGLQDGQEVTILFVIQVKIPILVLHIILHVCRKTILICDADLLFSEITIKDSPIGLVIHAALLQRGGQVFRQFMNIKDALGLLEYNNPKGFHNAIVNVMG